MTRLTYIIDDTIETTNYAEALIARDKGQKVIKRFTNIPDVIVDETIRLKRLSKLGYR